jgi:hypothetical protein
VEADRSQLAELAQRLRDGRLTSNVGLSGRWPKCPPRSAPTLRACPGRRSSGSPRAGSPTAIDDVAWHRWGESRVADNAGACRTRARDPRFAAVSGCRRTTREISIR